MSRFVRRVARTVTTVVIVAVVLLQAAVLAAESPKIRLASDRWPPFTNVAGETRLAIDLVHKALERAGVQVDTTVVEWKDVTAGLRNGRFDGSAAIWHSADRETFLLFSEPYLENRLVLVGNKGSDVSAVSLADLAGKRVGVVEQYAYGETVETAEGPLFIDAPSDQHNLEKLLGGEVDYMLVDELLIRYLVEHQQEEATRFLQIGGTPLLRRALHFAVRRELPDAEPLIEKFNTEINEMLADGTYNVILRLDWIRADVDGDGRPEFVPRNTQAGEIPPTAGYSILSTIPRESPVKALDRYWIDGRVYENWEAVPERYKTRPRTDTEKPPPALLRF
jgi:ABC-type amino acid transport substrate-binding protein